MPELRFAPLRAEDLGPVLALARVIGTFTEEELACLGGDIAAHLEELASGVESEDTLETLFFGGQVAGFLQYGPLPITEGSFMLHWILVDARLQGAGLGRRSIERMEVELAARGARRVFIETADTLDFARPRAFYERAGYALVATIPDYYGEQNSKCVFRKVL